MERVVGGAVGGSDGHEREGERLEGEAIGGGVVGWVDEGDVARGRGGGEAWRVEGDGGAVR